jgi:diguanylate cyclase (GGDEF)-like protein
MIDRALRQVRYENHLRTLRALGVELGGLAVFDAARRLVWEERVDETLRRAIQHALERNDGGVRAGLRCLELPGNQVALVFSVDDDTDGEVLALMLTSPATGPWPASSIPRIQAALQAVADNIVAEFRLNEELEAMAVELGDRYEELNLVYQTDAASSDSAAGHESLRRLVRDTAEFLDVPMAALLMPQTDTQLYHLDRRIPTASALRFFAKLCGRPFERLRGSRQAIVVNSAGEMIRELLPQEPVRSLLIVPVQGGGAEVVGMLLIARDLDHKDFSNSDRNLLEVMATKMTKILQINFDSLTGLENSFSFEWAVSEALQQENGRGTAHTVLHVDVDRTGVVNDICGREAGDEVIRIIGRILTSRARTQDTVARMSGDEFGILLKACPLESAARFASAVAEQVAATEFRWKDAIQPLSICIGVVPITAESDSAAAVISSAQVACDAAKEKGHNCIQVYEHNNADLLRRRGEFRWVGQIQAALRDDGLVLYAQEIRPLSTDDPLPHYEVLVRILDDKGVPIPPTDFIPAAEHYHQMSSIDRWVLRAAVDALFMAASDHPLAPLQLAVNLSGQSLADEHFKAFALEQLGRLGPVARNLCFEITESAAISNMQQAIEFIAACKAEGCRFSLDDFGSGLSSFAYLQRFDVDFLKIDGSFVSRIGHDRVAHAMVAAINQVGQVMGLATIAEFVDTGLIDQSLREIGVDYGQGVFYHSPEPLRDVLRNLTRAPSAALA